MVFTFCTTVCPVMTPNMLHLQKALEEEGVDIQFVTFTVDPERDTPEHLKNYGLTHHSFNKLMECCFR